MSATEIQQVGDARRLWAYAGIVSLIYICLPLLILVGIIPFSAKFIALVAGGAVVYALLRLLGAPHPNLGIRRAFAFKSLLYTAPITLALLIGTVTVYQLNGSRFVPTETIGFYVFYIAISCPVQEFL